MNDEQIIEYLRSRSQVQPPIDLVSSVMAEVDAAPPRRSWLAFWVPAGVAAAAVATVLVLALFLSQRAPDVGPAPPDSAAPSVSTPPSPQPTREPSAEASATTIPQENEPSYVAVDGLPFTVLESSEADALFEEDDGCANNYREALAYTVRFPATWHAGEENCSWFVPAPFAPPPSGERPDEVWITIEIIDGDVGYTSATEVFLTEEVTTLGLDGRRAEYNPDPSGEPDFRAYHYVFPIGDISYSGHNLVASTDNEMASNYALAKAVLDRMMASLGLIVLD